MISKLHIGALPPNSHDSSYNIQLDSSTGIKAYLKNDEIDENTIFEFIDEKGRKLFLKNLSETVHIIDDNRKKTGYSFRNLPQFMSLILNEVTIRDAQYETDAVLDHYFYHDNTAPFIARRLIHRLVLSNPSPRYIKSVATAFRTGRYLYEFGTGEYGDLASTVAAIYLDR